MERIRALGPNGGGLEFESKLAPRVLEVGGVGSNEAESFLGIVGDVG